MNFCYFIFNSLRKFLIFFLKEGGVRGIVLVYNVKLIILYFTGDGLQPHPLFLFSSFLYKINNIEFSEGRSGPLSPALLDWFINEGCRIIIICVSIRYLVSASLVNLY